MSPRGGTREGAGRPAGSCKPDRKKNRTIKFTDSEWSQIKQAAKSHGLTATKYMRMKLLDKE